MQFHTTGIVLAALTVVSAASAQTTQAVEWKVSEGGNGHWYASHAAPKQWIDAKLAAEGLGGHLTTITSPAEMAFVFSVSGPYPHWLGGKQFPGSCEPICGWTWVTGEAWGYSNWSPAEPNNMGNQDTLKMYEDGTWDDTCGCESQRYLVEWESDCNSDGIVDYGQVRGGTFADFNGNNIPDCCERGEPCVLGNYPVEWKVGDGGNGHWYQVINLSGQGKIYWNASRSRAIEAGGDLACFESAAETNAFLKLTSGQTRGNPWMGLYQDRKASDYTEPAGGWRWTSGASLAWTNWASGEPNNAEGEDWANMWIDFGPVGTWNDYKPTDPQGPDGFIIEWTADCNSDGIVDYGQILRGDLVDRDENGVPDSCQCASNGSLDICCTSDLDLDGEVSTSDISLLLLSFGEQRWLAPAYDLDRDGAIGGGDLSVILLDFGPCYQTPLAAPAPEIPPLLDAQALPDATRHR